MFSVLCRSVVAVAGVFLFVFPAYGEWQLTHEEISHRREDYVSAVAEVETGSLVVRCEITSEGSKKLAVYNTVNENVFSPIVTKNLVYRVDGQEKPAGDWVGMNYKLYLVGDDARDDILHFAANLSRGKSLTLDYFVSIPDQTYSLTGVREPLSEVLTTCGEDPAQVFALATPGGDSPSHSWQSSPLSEKPWPEFELPSATIHSAEAEPLSFRDAKLSLGYPKAFVDKRFSNDAKVFFAIIDSGFAGLDDWLATHPKEKKITHYVNLRESGKPSSGNHGYHVYRANRAELPFAELYLLEYDLTNSGLEKAIAWLNKNHVMMANLSSGRMSFLGEPRGNMTEPQFVKTLNDYEITLFQAIGNERGAGHYFPYLDEDGDGVLEFIAEDKAGALPTEFNRVYLQGNRQIYARLLWNERGNVQSRFELQLLDKQGKVLASASSNGKWPAIALKYTSPEDRYAWFKVIDKGAVDTESLRFVLQPGTYTKKGFFNGFELTSEMSKFESPFLISVGAYGMGEDGKLRPSVFSSIGQTVDGALLPHILGPGQLDMDGEVINGTSFASPFLAGLLGNYGTYNLKNLVEASSSHKKLEEGRLPVEKSRWGIPDFMVMLEGTSECFENTKVENISHQITDKDLVINYDLSRNCMEGLTYYPSVKFSGLAFNGKTLELEKLSYKKSSGFLLRGSARYKHNDGRDIVQKKVTIKVPLDQFERRFFDVDLDVHFDLATKAQPDPIKLSRDTYSLNIPRPFPIDDSYKGIKAYEILDYLSKRGLTLDTIDLAGRAIGSGELDKEQLGKSYWLRGKAHMRLKHRICAIADFEKARELLVGNEDVIMDFGAAYFAKGEYAKAENVLAMLEDSETHGFNGAMFRALCAVFLKQNLDSILQKVAATNSDVTVWPGALVGMLQKKISMNDLFKVVMSSSGHDRVDRGSWTYLMVGHIALFGGDTKGASKGFSDAMSGKNIDDGVYWVASGAKDRLAGVQEEDMDCGTQHEESGTAQNDVKTVAPAPPVSKEKKTDVSPTPPQEQNSNSQDEAEDGMLSMGRLHLSLSDEGRSRYLTLSLSVLFTTNQKVNVSDAAMQDIKGAVVGLVEGKTYTEIKSYEGKVALKKELYNLFSRKLNRSDIQDVYFTEFIVQ